MTGRELIDQAMRSSVDRALKLQPRKARRVADELLYSAPAERDAVAALHAAGCRLVEARLAVSATGAVAARHGSASMTVSRRGADLTQLDARHLVRVALDGDAEPDDAPAAVGLLREIIRVGAAAAVWAHPVALLACAAAGVEPDRSVSDELSAMAETVTVIPGRGAVAAGADPLDAVARLEVAERLAEITLAFRRFGA
ncbi:MAG: class II aldolase/adducin family protein [Acidimicrobiales bacterium]